MKPPDDETAALRQEITRLRSALSKLTPNLENLLRLRGFRIYKKEPMSDLLVPEPAFIEQYYKALKKYSFRLFLRDVIKYQDRFTEKDVTRYATSEATKDYIDYLIETGLAEKIDNSSSDYRLKRRPIKSFGETLEWFLSEIFRREFSTEAIWGIKFKRPMVGGDYDLIAKINGSLLYMEVKSSPPKQISAPEITAFLNRTEDLNAEVAIFFMDTELRMKDKIAPMFEEELKGRHKQPPEVRRMEKELFQISDKVFIINAKGGITNNIEKALSWYFYRRKR